jgi:hypothetical protein
MDTEIKASKVPAKNAFGQNGYQGASSLTPGQTKPPIKNVSPPTAKADAGDWQTRDVGKSNVKPHVGMADRTVSSGSPGGAVPKSLSYGREAIRSALFRRNFPRAEG